MENIVQLNPYVNMTFDQLMIVSNNAMKNPNEQLLKTLMNEFSRRLQKESEILSQKIKEVRGNL